MKTTNYDLMTQDGRNASDHRAEHASTLTRLPIGSNVTYSSVEGGPISLAGKLLSITPDTLIAEVESETGAIEYIDARLLK